MKKRGRIWVIAALVLVLAMSTGVQAAMYVEGFLGGTTASSPGSGSPKLIGGGRWGMWFAPEGALGLNYPKWMNYLGLYIDVSYHALNVNSGPFHGSSGHVATWAFMAAGRCGFIKDDEVPFGRLQPYVGIGLADLNVSFTQSSTEHSTFTLAFVLDAGVRYMINKRLSVDLFFRYRHAQPNLTYNLFSGMAGIAYHF
jgi:opacity protein-like surface antigen